MMVVFCVLVGGVVFVSIVPATLINSYRVHDISRALDIDRIMSESGMQKNALTAAYKANGRLIREMLCTVCQKYCDNPRNTCPCQLVRYCSRRCQKQHWHIHKKSGLFDHSFTPALKKASGIIKIHKAKKDDTASTQSSEVSYPIPNIRHQQCVTSCVGISSSTSSTTSNSESVEIIVDDLITFLFEKQLFSAIIKSRPDYDDVAHRDCQHDNGWIYKTNRQSSSETIPVTVSEIKSDGKMELLDHGRETDHEVSCNKGCGFALRLRPLAEIRNSRDMTNATIQQYIDEFGKHLSEQLKPYYPSQTSRSSRSLSMNRPIVHFVRTEMQQVEDAFIFSRTVIERGGLFDPSLMRESKQRGVLTSRMERPESYPSHLSLC